MLMDALSALAEPRRKIIEILATDGELSATQIYTRFDITPQAEVTSWQQQRQH